MDWEALREKTLGEVGTTLAVEGAGVSVGLLGAGFIGRQIENIVMGKTGTLQNYVTTGDPLTTKFKAWASNNIPKIGVWYLMRNYAKVEPGETVTPGKEIAVDAKKAIAGSVVFDSVIRLLNSGVPAGPYKLFGYDVLGSDTGNGKQTQALQADMQRLIQENSALRTELNKALQRIASTPTPVAIPAPTVQTQAWGPQQAQPAPQPIVQATPPVIRYQPVVQAPIQVSPAPAPVAVQPAPPAIVERERKYGFMQYETTPPVTQERERKYGFSSAGNGEKGVAAMFGML